MLNFFLQIDTCDYFLKYKCSTINNLLLDYTSSTTLFYISSYLNQPKSTTSNDSQLKFQHSKDLEKYNSCISFTELQTLSRPRKKEISALPKYMKQCRNFTAKQWKSSPNKLEWITVDKKVWTQKPVKYWQSVADKSLMSYAVYILS